jgi:hypothetical protein
MAEASMAVVLPPLARPDPSRVRAPIGSQLLAYLRTTDHKEIGKLYLVTSFRYFLVGGAMAMLMRAELARPGLQFLSPEQYNQLFTMHGTIMLLLYATPIVFAFANLVLPLQIGSPDVAFPRLNAFSYWLFAFGGLIVISGFLTPGGAADFGWFAYTPLSDAIHSPGVGGDLWVMGLVVAGLGTILGAVNMITTVICLRAPGMTMWRMPIFHLEHPVHLNPGPARFPGPDRSAIGLGGRSADRGARVRPRQRWGDPVAAPVLVFRSPRGLHCRASLFRYRDRNLPRLQPQTESSVTRP